MLAVIYACSSCACTACLAKAIRLWCFIACSWLKQWCFKKCQKKTAIGVTWADMLEDGIAMHQPGFFCTVGMSSLQGQGEYELCKGSKEPHHYAWIAWQHILWSAIRRDFKPHSGRHPCIGQTISPREPSINSHATILVLIYLLSASLLPIFQV